MHQQHFLPALRPRKCTPKQAHFQARKRPGKAADYVVRWGSSPNANRPARGL